MIHLNLLPPGEKENLKMEKIQHGLWLWTALVAGVLIFFLIMLATVYFSIISVSKTAEEDFNLIQASAQGKNLKSQQDLIKDFNLKLGRIEILQKEHKYYSTVLIELIQFLPEGVRLENLTIDEKNQAILSGFAPRREEIIALKDNLEKSKKIANVKNPLSNLIKQTDISFYLKFNLTEEALKND